MSLLAKQDFSRLGAVIKWYYTGRRGCKIFIITECKYLAYSTKPESVCTLNPCWKTWPFYHIAFLKKLKNAPLGNPISCCHTAHECYKEAKAITDVLKASITKEEYVALRIDVLELSLLPDHVYRGIISLWNLLPQGVEMATNMEGFKRGLDEFMSSKSY